MTEEKKVVEEKVESADEEEYLVSFQLISVAGTAKSYAMQAIQKAREFDFDAAEQFLNEAREIYVESHEIQTNMLNEEAAGNKTNVHIFLVHSQDHLTMANMAIENAKEFISIYKMIYELKNK